MGDVVRLNPPQLKRLSEELKRRWPDVVNAVAATVQTNRAMLFDREGAYNGHTKWAPISRPGRILQDTGRLRRSIVPGRQGSGKPGANGVIVVDARIVRVETKVEYAATHENGDPKRNIKRRSFMQKAWNKKDEAEVIEVVTKKVQRIIEEILK
jgi:phage gpG-like protein